MEFLYKVYKLCDKKGKVYPKPLLLGEYVSLSNAVRYRSMQGKYKALDGKKHFCAIIVRISDNKQFDEYQGGFATWR